MNSNVNIVGKVGLGDNFVSNIALDISASDAIKVPVGETSERPQVGVDGMLRYNSTLLQFEGYSTSAWKVLGGVIDIDQDTYITAEKEGNDDDTLTFYNAGEESMTIDPNGDV